MSVHVSSTIWLAEFPTPAMKLVALKLADCSNSDGENIYPSASRVARETGLAISTVRQVLADLEAAGLLVVIEEKPGSRFNRSTTNRRWALDLLRDIAAVDNRDGSFVPPTHILESFDTGLTRTNKSGVEVPVISWRVRARTDADRSVYDDLVVPARDRHARGRLVALQTPPESGGVNPSGHRRGQGLTPPADSSDPSDVRSDPSGERTLTVIEPSEEQEPQTPLSGASEKFVLDEAATDALRWLRDGLHDTCAPDAPMRSLMRLVLDQVPPPATNSEAKLTAIARQARAVSVQPQSKAAETVHRSNASIGIVDRKLAAIRDAKLVGEVIAIDKTRTSRHRTGWS